MPYNIKADKYSHGNLWSIGDIGENYVKYKLSQKRIDSIIIDRTYDLFLWQRNHRIEVKASHIGSRSIDNSYNWNFKHWQTKKDAFDYAVCVGLNSKEEIKVVYIIPQPYLHKLATKIKPKKNGGTTLSINIDNRKFSLDGNTYDKFECCRYPNIDFDIFLQDNKSVFTRRKNRLTKKLLEFSDKHRAHIFSEVVDAFNDKSIKHPTKMLKNKLGLNWDVIANVRKLLGITAHHSTKAKKLTIYTCDKCGLTTYRKATLKRHMNRKTPCGVKKK